MIYITLNIDLRLYLKKDKRKSRVLIIIIERVCNVSTSSSSLSVFSLYLIFLDFAFLESMNFVPLEIGKMTLFWMRFELFFTQRTHVKL